MSKTIALPSEVLQGALLSTLARVEVERLLAQATPLEFKAGDVLMAQGDTETTMLLLVSGAVVVKRDGRTLGKYGVGTVVGEMGFLDPAPRTASTTATSKGSAYCLHRDGFMDMIKRRDPAAIKTVRALTSIACKRLQGMNELVQEEVLGPSQKGVFRRLWNKVTSRGK